MDAILDILKSIENGVGMIAGLTLAMFMFVAAILLYAVLTYNK